MSETLSEADLAARLHELGEQRAAVQAEADRPDAEIDRLETELAGRGAGARRRAACAGPARRGIVPGWRPGGSG